MVSIIISTTFIFFRYNLTGLALIELIYLDRTFDTKIQICADKDIYDIFIIFQYVVGAASHDDASTFFCHFTDHIGLCQENAVVQRQSCKSCILIRKDIHSHRDRIEQTVCRLILYRLKCCLRKSGFFGCPGNNLIVVKRNS